MQTLFDQLKSIRRTLIISIVGLSLWGLLSVGYVQAAPAGYQENEIGSIQTTERYDQIQSEAGGINGFDDTDPRRNTAKAEAKAQKLSDVAKRRQAQADEPLDTAKEVLNNLKDDLLGD